MNTSEAIVRHTRGATAGRGWDAVAYSPATRRAMTALQEQLDLGQRYIDSGIAHEREQQEYARMATVAFSLATLAEAHRQWTDYDNYTAAQVRYYRYSRSD